MYWFVWQGASGLTAALHGSEESPSGLVLLPHALNKTLFCNIRGAELPFCACLCSFGNCFKLALVNVQLVKADGQTNLMVECHDAVPLFQLAIIGKKAQHAQGHNFAVQVRPPNWVAVAPLYTQWASDEL